MTFTDHAFIKAYSEANQEPFTPSRLPLIGEQPPVQNTISTVVENVNHVHSVEVRHAEYGSANVQPYIYVQQAGSVATTNPKLGKSDSAPPKSPDQHQIAQPQRWRIDPTDPVIPPGPHTNASAYQVPPMAPSAYVSAETNVAAENISDRETLVRTRGFRANWEVDRFQCPRLCQRLQSLAGDQLYRISTSLLPESKAEGTIAAFTGVNSAEGRTTVLIALANVAATLGKRIAIIDGHLTKPSLGPMLGIQLDRGWESVSLGMPIGDAAVASLSESAILFPLGRSIRWQQGAYSLEGADSLLKSLRKNFDLVLLDAGPMFVAAHNWFNQACAHLVDTAIILSDKRHVNVEQINDASSRIAQAGVTSISILENFSP